MLWSILIRRSLFLILITSILQIDSIDFLYKSWVLDGLVALNILILLKSIGGVSGRLIFRIFSQRRFQRNIVGLTTNWLFSRGFINILALSFLAISLLPWIPVLFSFTLWEMSDAQTEVYRNAGLLMAYIGLFLDSPLTFSWLRKIDLTPSRLIFVSYGLAILAGTILLILPWSLRENVSITLVNAMFTAVSALTVAGLHAINFADTFSLFGQIVIMLLIQIGGLGILALSVAFVAIAGKKLSIHHTLMGSELYNTNQVGGLSAYLAKITATTLIIEMLGAIYIYLSLPAGIENRFFHALFHAVSAFCNAGFSSFSQNLEIGDLVGLKVAVCVLIVLGGLGFPVFNELLTRLKPVRAYQRFSGHTFLVLMITISLLLIGGGVIGLIEWTHFSKLGTDPSRIFGEAMFYSVSSRTAGFNMTPPEALNFASQFVIAMLMVIGGSPMSTAGGIKITTVGVLVVAAWSNLRGRRWIQFRRSTIPLEALQKAVTIVLLYICLLIVAVGLLSTFESKRLWELTFECISAMSTVGLTLGVTPDLTNASKIVIIFLMLAGRVGLVSLAYLGLGRISNPKLRYAEDNYYVG